jgi:alkaline phosphatase D
VIDRRRFLLGLAGLAGGACAGGAATTSAPTTGTPTTVPPRPAPTTTSPSPTTTRQGVEPLETVPVDLPPDFFGNGVASGDPSPDGVVLWTRGIGDALPDQVPLVWEISTDPAFTALIATGRVVTGADRGHAVHAPVGGLSPVGTYHYRFRAGERTSPVGRTRTLPDPGTLPGSFRLAVSSCQLFELGHYAAHRHLADEDVDLVLWLGDFVYEGTGSALPGRGHRGGEARDLAGYRDRYAQYRADPHLQAAQAAHPWVVVWDDHEVANDYAGTTVSGSDEPGFGERRSAAYRAWWENQPVALGPPDEQGLSIHRRFDLGMLARLVVLDTRQFRDPQPCRDGAVVRGWPLRRRCDDVETTSMLGSGQREWLLAELAGSTGVWTLLGQQVLFGGLDAGLDGPAVLTDTWDGYAGERRLVADALGRAPGPVVLSGDLHTALALDVRADPFDRTTPVLATELMAPAISSPFPASPAALAGAVALLNPHIHHVDPGNGYLVVTLTPDRLVAEYRTLADATDPDSPIATSATVTVVPDRPGVAR